MKHTYHSMARPLELTWARNADGSKLEVAHMVHHDNPSWQDGIPHTSISTLEPLSAETIYSLQLVTEVSDEEIEAEIANFIELRTPEDGFEEYEQELIDDALAPMRAFRGRTDLGARVHRSIAFAGFAKQYSLGKNL